jgi:hypothetical protein
MAISNIPKTGYMYDGTDWHPIAGSINTAENFSWTGSHTFSQSAIFSNSLVARRGVNNFSSTAERATSIPSPTNGTMASVTINSITYPQYYAAGDWRLFSSNAFIETRTSADFVAGTLNYQLRAADMGKTILMNHTAAHNVQIQLNSAVAIPVGSQVAIVAIGSGQVSITGVNTSVFINSKLGNRKLATQYSQAVLVKTGTDTWLLVGDLTA